jgi:dephospho-CoA kinase
MPHRILKIGLTGGIGSGKTTVSNLFAIRGVPVIDADVIARELLQPGSESTRLVIREFGDDILDSEGNIDRAILRRRVFDDGGARKKLESILHPLVHQEIESQVRSVSGPYCIIVIPLLVETGYSNLVDRILVIDCPPQTQIERASLRDRADRGQIEKIVSAQISRGVRLDSADDIIDNSTNISSLEQQVAELDAKYRKLAQQSI